MEDGLVEEFTLKIEVTLARNSEVVQQLRLC